MLWTIYAVASGAEVKMVRVKIVFLALCCWMIPAQLAAQGGALSPADVKAINDTSERFATAVLARDLKGITALYAADGVLYPPGETAAKGHAAIEACLGGLPRMADFKLRNTKVEGAGDVAYVQGTYMMTVKTADGAKADEQSGYFLEVRRKQPDGRWLIAVHMLAPHQ